MHATFFHVYVYINTWQPLSRAAPAPAPPVPNLTPRIEVQKTPLVPITTPASPPYREPRQNTTCAATPGELAAMRKRSVIDSKDIPLKIPVKETIDKHGVMWKRLYATGHAAEGLLNNYSTEGFPVHCGED